MNDKITEEDTKWNECEEKAKWYRELVSSLVFMRQNSSHSLFDGDEKKKRSRVATHTTFEFVAWNVYFDSCVLFVICLS